MPTSVSEPLIEFLDGKKYLSWEVTQPDIATADHAVISDVPTFCTLTLYEMDADGVNTEFALGLEASFVPSDTDLDTIVRGSQPRAFVRNQCRVNIRTADNILVVYSSPAATATVITRVTVREGHE